MAQVNHELFQKLDEGKKKIMYRAMELSHGRANNSSWVPFLESDTITAENIAEISNGLGEETNSFHTIWEKNTRQNKHHYNSKKEYRDEVARLYAFEDTFIYRAAKAAGFDTDILKEKYTSRSFWPSYRKRNSWVASVNDNYNTFDDIRSEFKVANTTNNVYCSGIGSYYGAYETTDTLYMFYHANKDLRKRITEDADLNKFFTTNAKIFRRMEYVPDKVAHTYSEEEFRKKQKEWVIQEFDWLAHMNENDKEFRNRTFEAIKDGHWSWSNKLFTAATLSSFRYKCSDMALETVGEAFRAMEYLGIGVVGNADNEHLARKGYYDSYRGATLAKKICSSVRTFNRDVKKGISVEDARELLVEDLNNWVKGQGRDLWRFFIRTDAPEHYPEIEPKKKEKPIRVKKSDITENTKRTSKVIEVNSVEEFINLTKE